MINTGSSELDSSRCTPIHDTILQNSKRGSQPLKGLKAVGDHFSTHLDLTFIFSGGWTAADAATTGSSMQNIQ